MTMQSFSRTNSYSEAQSHILMQRVVFGEYRPKEHGEVRLMCVVCSAGDYYIPTQPMFDRIVRIRGWVAPCILPRI